MSQDYDKSASDPGTIIKNLQGTIDRLTGERDSMVIELDDLRTECYELRRVVEASKNKEAADARAGSLGIEKAMATATAAGSATVAVPKAELEGYKKQLDQQEMLINGFQKENEKLVQEIKVKTEMFNRERGEILKDRESLNVKANKWENAYASVSQSQKNLKESCDNLRSTLDHEKLISSLREELGAAKESAKVADERNLEMKYEIDKLRKERKDMLLESEGLSAEKIDRQEKDTAMLKALLKKERAMHAHAMEASNAKLNWYIQNQEMVDRDAAILEEQNTLIAKLRAKLAGKSDEVRDTLSKADGEQPNLEPSVSNQNKKTAKKIRDLETQVKDLEEALNRRHPDSISNLIRAIGPSQSVELRNKERNVENRRLREELDKVKEDSERRLRALRQEHEKMKLGLEKQIRQVKKDVDANTKNIGGEGGGVVSKGGAGGDSNSNDTIERLRQYYTKKIQDQEKKFEAQLRAAKRGSAGTRPTPAVSVDKNVTQERVRELEQLVSKQKEMIKMMEGASLTRTSNDSQRTRDLESRLGVMQGRVKFAEREAESLKVSLAAAEARLETTVKLSEEQSKAMTATAVANAVLNSSGNSSLEGMQVSMSSQQRQSNDGQSAQVVQQPSASYNA